MVETGEREETTGKAAGIFLVVFAFVFVFVFVFLETREREEAT